MYSKHNTRTAVRKKDSAMRLIPKVQKTNQKITNVGSVGDLAVGHVQSRLGIFTASFTSASGSNKNYKVGDPNGLVQAVDGRDMNVADASSAGNGTALNAIFGNVRVLISGLNIKTSSSASQFSQTTQFITATPSGDLSRMAIRVSASQRNTQQNTLIQTVRFDEPLELGPNSCFFFTVLDGQDVDVDFFPAADTGLV